MAIVVKKLAKEESKLRLAITGPTGSGKTFTALTLAKTLAGGDINKVFVLDTEKGSAKKYSDEFGVLTGTELSSFHPALYEEAIEYVNQHPEFEVLVIDSLSHAWSGTGGVLDQADMIAKRNKSANSFAAWKEATPMQNALIDAILSCRCHVIVTMRSKMEYILEAVERNGRTTSVPRKVGMAPVQRDDVQYEFDVIMDMDLDNSGSIVKTRCAKLAGEVIRKPGQKLAKVLLDWVSGGVPHVSEPARPAVNSMPQPEVAGPLPLPEPVVDEDPGHFTEPSTPAAPATARFKEQEPPGVFWSERHAIELRQARAAVQKKLRENPTYGPEFKFGEDMTRQWLKNQFGLDSHKKVNAEQFEALKGWMRRVFAAGSMVN